MPSASVLPSLFGPKCDVRSRVRLQTFSRLRLMGITEPVSQQEWGHKILTVSWSAVGHVELVGLSLSGVRERAWGAFPGKLEVNPCWVNFE